MSAIDVRLEALLAGDAPRGADETRLAAVIGELRGATLRAPDALRARVVSAAPAPRRFAFPARRLVLVAVPAVLALAVVAAVVHGLTGSSGSRPVSEGPVTQTLGRAVAAPPVFKAATSHGAAVGAGGALNSAHAAPAPPVGTPGRLQHTDASLQVRVPDAAHLSAATSAATRIATSLGGYAQSVDYRTPQHGEAAAYLELRVPAQNVQRALTRLAALGTLVSQQISVQDLEHALQAESAQIAELRRTVAALEQALRNPALPDAQRVLLQIRLAESKRALSQRLAARGGTVAAGATARISLVLGTAKAIVAPVTHHRGRLGRMLHSALGFLGLEAMVALYAVIVISPFAVLGALAWFLARLRRRRDEQRLLAA
ncbi:MAG TPA: DUF4349 domain-containing protein [Gaiellaceae bacterium]|nr:DUF4349 domain-containing protein [Gaiellaceae bacterium]